MTADRWRGSARSIAELARRCPSAHPHRAAPCSAITIHNFLTIDRAAHRSSAGPAQRSEACASASGACARSRWCSRTGAIERPLVFGNNDRPGVMLASAVSAYVNRYGVRPGARAVVFTNNDGAYRRRAGSHSRRDRRCAAVVDARSDPHGSSPRRMRARRRRPTSSATPVVVDVAGARRRVMRCEGHEADSDAPARLPDSRDAIGVRPALRCRAA